MYIGLLFMHLHIHPIHTYTHTHTHYIYKFLLTKKCCIYIYIYIAQETKVQSQVVSYQRLKKWFLMLPCLTLSIIRQGSRVKWSNPGKGVASSATSWCCSNRKGTLRVIVDYSHNLYFTYLGLWIQTLSFLLLRYFSGYVSMITVSYSKIYSLVQWNIFTFQLSILTPNLSNLNLRHTLELRLIKSEKTVSSWKRKETEGTPQKQLPTPTTPMT